MVPLVLPALLVFSRLAPDAGRSAAFGIVASLPLPHSPAALCFRPIIPLPDDPGALFVQGALVASIVEEIFLLLQIHNWKRGPEKSIQNPRSVGNETKRIPTPSGELRPLSRSALPAGESSPFASEVEIHPIHTCP